MRKINSLVVPLTMNQMTELARQSCQGSKLHCHDTTHLVNGMIVDNVTNCLILSSAKDGKYAHHFLNPWEKFLRRWMEYQVGVNIEITGL